MVSSVLSSFVVLCVFLLPAVWGRTDSCSSYWDGSGSYHVTQECGSQYCCGDCNKKYCCSEKKHRLTQEQQDRCPARPGNENKISNIAIILGAIFGCILVLIPCVALIICCVTPCCLIHNKCQERRNKRHQTAITTVISTPQQPLNPSGYQLPHPGPSTPTAPPPSYQEATDPANFPGPFTQMYPMHPFEPLGQPNEPPPDSQECSQLSYNPSYDPHSYTG